MNTRDNDSRDSRQPREIGFEDGFNDSFWGEIPPTRDFGADPEYVEGYRAGFAFGKKQGAKA